MTLFSRFDELKLWRIKVFETFTTTKEHLCDIRIMQRSELNFGKAKGGNVSSSGNNQFQPFPRVLLG